MHHAPTSVPIRAVTVEDPRNAQKPQAEESLWDVKDVVAYSKVSRSWVYQNAAAGLLPHLKIGGLLRFNPSAIRSWALESQEKPRGR
jgi:predicted DNA-binding transcriptional regulator AlpA